METGLQKVAKQFDGLKARNAKLVEENQKLKTQLAEYKSVNSRIRRVPQAKKDKADATKGDTGAAPATPQPVAVQAA